VTPEDLGPGQLATAAALLLLNAVISMRLRLGLGRQILMASVRSVVQLSLLGLLLQWVFARNTPWTVVAVMLVMTVAAGIESVRRTKHRTKGVFGVGIGVMLVTASVVTVYGVAGAVRVDPWWTPQYAIPILGMVLGNTLTGVSLGLETVLAGFSKQREEVELLLAHGATPREAGEDIVRDAVRLGTVPILNAMVAAGLISIPGMMTGQILGGQDPVDAARYQILILFLIAGATALGTLSVVWLAARLVFDERGRLRAERIQTRP
jgi:putative ABC transport system permease protein